MEGMKKYITIFRDQYYQPKNNMFFEEALNSFIDDVEYEGGEVLDIKVSTDINNKLILIVIFTEKISPVSPQAIQ